MSTQRRPMTKANEAHAVTYYKGRRLTPSNSITMRGDGRARLPITIGDVPQQDTPCVADATNACPPSGAPTQRPHLVNMKCGYFRSFTGRARPDFCFLLDEKPEDAVFHDSSEKTRFRSSAAPARRFPRR